MDKTGHFGTIWETPPFRIHPHLALLRSFQNTAANFIFSGKPGEPRDAIFETTPDRRCLESRFAVCSDSNRHRFTAISNRTIRIARPQTVRLAYHGKALLFVHFNGRFQIAPFDPLAVSNRWRSVT